MPRLTALRSDVMADLARQVRFASRSALLKQIENAEALAAEIDPAQDYPEDWLIFRVTGFVPEHARPRVLPGAKVLADLSSLAERLSVAAELRETEPWPSGGAAPLDTPALCRRWGVTRRTIERYRREGLVARRVISDSARGRVRLLFSGACVEAFERRTGLVPRDAAPPPPRASPAERDRWRDWASRFLARAGCPWSEAVRRLARRTGRSPSTIRRALRPGARGPISSRTAGATLRAPTIRSRERRVIVRAVRAGVSLPALASRFRRGVPAVARALTLGRLERLAALGLPAPDARSPSMHDALAAPLLLDERVRSDDAPWPRDAEGLLDLLLHAGEGPDQPPRAADEMVLATAHAHLIRLAASVAASGIGHSLEAGLVDEAETALRWASRLRRRMLRDALPLISRTLRERGLLEPAAPTAGCPRLLGCLHAASSALQAWSPDRGGRAAAPISLALARELAAPPAPAARLALTAWDDALSMPPWVERGLATLDDRERDFIRARFGTHETPPMTAQHIRERFGVNAPAWWSAYRRAAHLQLHHPPRATPDAPGPLARPPG